MNFVLTAHLSLDAKFSQEILNVHLDFKKILVEKVDCCTQVVPNVLKSLVITESSISFYTYINLNRNSVPQLHWPHFKVLKTTHANGYHLGQMYNCILTEILLDYRVPLHIACMIHQMLIH